MLSPFDDYPIHQTAEPIAHPASSDRNVYDRYFFHGYDRAGTMMWGLSMALYPNRQIIDAAFSIVQDGVQTSIHASGRLRPGTRPTQIGPIAVTIERPLHTIAVRVTGPMATSLGVDVDLRFEARSVALEEPRHRALGGTTRLLDATRLTQWGDWSGSIAIDDTSIQVEATTFAGLRDRSWGIRPAGEATGGAPSHELPHINWAWSPIRFDDTCLHGAVNEHEDGARWYQLAERTAPLTAQGATAIAGDCGTGGDGTAHPLVDDGTNVERFRDVRYGIDFEPGTRRARLATVTFEPWNADPFAVTLEPLVLFPLKGLGYISADWSHGVWKDELAVGREQWRIDDLDPLDIHNQHIQQLCRATSGDRVGLGVLEQLAIGAHVPSGLTGFLDGAP